MNPEQARTAIFAALAEIAPEIDADTIDDGVDLQEQVDLDSMDYLNWLVGISKTTGIEIPHRDMTRFLTVNGAVAYLVEHSA